VVRIDFTLAIARPSADVFARLIDLDRLPEWQESSMVSSADGPLELGSVVKERRRIMGREFETELEVTSCDAPRQLTLKALGGPVPFTVDHQLVEDDGATLLHVVAEAKTGTFLKVAEPMLARTAEQELRKDFARLKEQLEGEGSELGAKRPLPD
jgi:carbon monoxide dehydrogenase subunit G